MTQKHPAGLFYLFVTEMWERFSFYAISAILALYLTKKLGLPDKEAGLASGAYMAFTFMTPILGGFVADKVLGLRYSVTTGGILILIGNLVLAWYEELTGVFIGLALVALGTGYLKSTVSVMVGKLYETGDSHRDSGYTLFYMGINVGALLAGLLMGYVAEKYGWTRGFYLSSAGMLLGLIAFQLGCRHYNNEADGFQRENLFKRFLGLPILAWIVAGTAGIGALMVYLFHHSGHTKIAIIYLSGFIVLGIFALAFACKERGERRSIYAILIIIVAAICFQSYFKQLYNSLTLFADRDFDKALFGIPLAPSFYALVPNSLSVIILAGVFTWLWGRLADKGGNPSIPMKIVMALCFAAASAALLAWVARGIAVSGEKASAWWIVLAIVILTVGELNILPMGLSAVSTLAPKRFASLLMGSWFLCNSLGGYISGYLASLADVEKTMVHEVARTASVYFNLYWKCALALGLVTLIMLAITPFVKKLMARQ
ncbi:MAG: peptide MFS transporter [bacterium]|nr:peptide MFS transporter [Candidatus Sumerlaeota bacterium]